MEEFNIRGLAKSDLDQIFRIISTREDFDEESARKRTKLLEWMAFHNPFARGRPTYYVAETSSNEVVAYLGRLPVEFSVGSEFRTFYFHHDLYVHPKARRKGLARKLYETVETCSDSVLLGGLWINDVNLNILKKREYRELTVSKYVRILDSRKLLDPRGGRKPAVFRQFIRLFHPLLNLIIRAGDAMLMYTPFNKIEVKEIDRFDGKLDEWMRKVLPSLGITVHRTSAYLNWKYADRPFNRNKIFIAERDGELAGYIVLGPLPRKSRWKGSILDIMADPQDSQTVAALCKMAIDHFHKANVFAINCVLTEESLIKIFKRFLFLKNPSKLPFFLTNLEKCPDIDMDLLQIGNWHLTYGDSDGFMFNF